MPNTCSVFGCKTKLFESSPVLVNIKEAAAKLQSSVSALESTELDEQGHPSTPSLPLLQFIICQLENSLVPTKKRRYNVVTQVSVSRFNISMHYLYLYLTLGRCFESTVDITYLLSEYSIIGLSYSSNNKSLHVLSSCIGLDSEYLHLLNQSTVDFSKRERHVVLNIDEIHVSSDISYQGNYWSYHEFTM